MLVLRRVAGRLLTGAALRRRVFQVRAAMGWAVLYLRLSGAGDARPQGPAGAEREGRHVTVTVTHDRHRARQARANGAPVLLGSWRCAAWQRGLCYSVSAVAGLLADSSLRASNAAPPCLRARPQTSSTLGTIIGRRR
jgi:hypothetical protein